MTVTVDHAHAAQLVMSVPAVQAAFNTDTLLASTFGALTAAYTVAATESGALLQQALQQLDAFGTAHGSTVYAITVWEGGVIIECTAPPEEGVQAAPAAAGEDVTVSE